MSELYHIHIAAKSINTSILTLFFSNQAKYQMQKICFRTTCLEVAFILAFRAIYFRIAPN